MTELGDYLEPSADTVGAQFRVLLQRSPVPTGTRQVTFLPVETLLCLAASFVIDYTRFGSSTATRAPEPVQQLAGLFRRPPSSVLAKMANLDGTRSHGGRWDQVAGATLRADPRQFSELYRMLIRSARGAGIGESVLPDFLGLESGGALVLLGQEELDTSALEEDIERRLRARAADESVAEQRETERILLGAARVGQHLFATRVLRNCGNRCVFCGFRSPSEKNQRFLVAGHIKPWRDCDNRERRDHRNGLAACPTHDVAFDTGLLTVNGGLRIHLAPALRRAVDERDVAQHYFARPPLRETLLIPEDSDPPGYEYLRWHRERIFAA